MSGKRPSLGKGLGDLGLSELLGDLGAPAVAISEPSIIETVTEEKPAEVDAVLDTKPSTETAVDATAAVETVPVPTPAAAPVSAPEVTATADGTLKKLAVDLLKPGRYQPRKTFDEEALQELADSIKAQGIIQPIVARRMNDTYEIIAGERRWRASQLAGLQEVPVIIKELSDEAALAMSLIENIQRKDLNVIEEAVALDRLIREFRLTHQEVAQAVGKSRTGVTNLLRLLKLNPDVRLLVENGDIEMGHARALLGLEGAEQSKVAHAIVQKGLSVRQSEQLIRRVHEVKAAARGDVKKLDPDVLRLQTELAEKLGANVKIQENIKGRGRVVVQYNSLEELQGILEHIN